MQIRRVQPEDSDEWVRMRSELWPDARDDHISEIEQYFENVSKRLATFVVENDHQRVCAFIEVATRQYAEGCRTSPVGYIEGWWVDPEYREQGVGTALVIAAECWARSLGLKEIASDASLGNSVSIDAHRALGFEEVERIVCFLKAL